MARNRIVLNDNNWLLIANVPCLIEIVSIKPGSVLLINESEDNSTAKRKTKLNEEIFQSTNNDTYVRSESGSKIEIIVDTLA